MITAALGRSPRLRLVLQFLGALMLWRGALFFLIYVTRIMIPERVGNWNKNWAAFPEKPFVDSFARWDSIYYFRIATQGYTGPEADLAFFPGFPLLVRGVAKLTGNPWIAGLVVSNLSLLAALFFVYGIALRYFDERDARRAVLWVLMFPTSLFFSMFYSESVFLLTVAATFYFYEREQLIWAALCGILAAFTRPTGILLCPALILGALHRGEYRYLSPRMLFLLLIPSGIALVAYLQYRAIGDPLAFINAQALWGRSSMSPLRALALQVHTIAAHRDGVQAAFDCLAVVGLFSVVALSLHTLDLAHSVFAALSVLVPLSSGRVLSMERFAACVVPLYLVLTRVTMSPNVERYAIYLASLSLALHTILFASWFFAG
jgi:hypothetical protein